jgi:hypothetical protein
MARCLTVKLSGRDQPPNTRCARKMIPARTARLLSSHGRSKPWLEGSLLKTQTNAGKTPMSLI